MAKLSSSATTLQINDLSKQIEKPFHDNIQTRILEKDYYAPKKSLTLCTKKTDPLSIDYYLSK